MKFKLSRNVFAIVTIACIAVIAISCDNTDAGSESISVRDDSAYSDLYAELTAFSKDFLATHTSVPQSRSSWKNIWTATKADYYSYVDKNNIYHQVISVGSSIKAYKDEKSKQEQQELQEGQTEVEVSDGEKEQIQSQIDSLKNEYLNDTTNFAALHNAAVYSMVLENNLNYKNDFELTNKVIKIFTNLGVSTKKLKPVIAYGYISDFFRDVYNENEVVLCQNLKTFYPAESNKVDILYNFLSTAQQLTNYSDLRSYAATYKYYILRANVSDADKRLLIGNLDLGLNSFDLWNNLRP